MLREPNVSTHVYIHWYVRIIIHVYMHLIKYICIYMLIYIYTYTCTYVKIYTYNLWSTCNGERAKRQHTCSYTLVRKYNHICIHTSNSMVICGPLGFLRGQDISTHVHIHFYISIIIYVYIYIHTCAYIHMYMYIYTYIYVSKTSYKSEVAKIVFFRQMLQGGVES